MAELLNDNRAYRPVCPECRRQMAKLAFQSLTGEWNVVWICACELDQDLTFREACDHQVIDIYRADPIQLRNSIRLNYELTLIWEKEGKSPA